MLCKRRAFVSLSLFFFFFFFWPINMSLEELSILFLFLCYLFIFYSVYWIKGVCDFATGKECGHSNSGLFIVICVDLYPHCRTVWSDHRVFSFLFSKEKNVKLLLSLDSGKLFGPPLLAYFTCRLPEYTHFILSLD